MHHMLHELQETLLRKRGLITDSDKEAFLNPDFDKHVYDPFLLPDMKKATDRIHAAIRNKELIVVYSDYDADGIPGAVIMHDFFRKIGYTNFQNYIPHRHHEGFGLNVEAIESFIANGAKLLITVDCGITDSEEIALATNAGVDVIITDHHIPHNGMPPAYAIVNPKLPGSQYPFDMLCGAAIAWKLVVALLKTGDFGIVPGWEKWLLDMVGIATLSDMVPLIGENRVLAQYGLKVARKSPRIGLITLLSKMRIAQRTLTEDDVGFMISPRINAASRMGHPLDAFYMLAATTEEEALERVNHLMTINDERKKLTASLSRHIESMLSSREEIPHVIVAGHTDWKPGILGLVANSIAESYKRPVFLWGRESGLSIKGSVRAGGSTNIVDLMKKVEHLFEDYGGHAASGGFSMTHEKVDLLEKALNESYEYRDVVDETKYEIDTDIQTHAINEQFVRMLETMAPFGLGNPKPIFQIKQSIPSSVRGFGKAGTHLEIILPVGVRGIKGIAFFKKQENFPALAENRPVDVICHIERSYWNGRAENRLRILDII